MTPGKRIVLAVLWLGLLGGGLWAYTAMMRDATGGGTPTTTTTPATKPAVPPTTPVTPATKPVVTPPPLPTVEDIPFTISSADLNTTLYGDIIESAAKALMNDGTVTVEIRGYQARDDGSAGNDELKLKRANAVLEELAARGVKRDRMKAVSGKASDSESEMNRKSKVVFVFRR